ncbi:restriction endonuclease subunit S [Citrobacter sp. Cb019]|uniref:restriction endonuclease subunit S n=1 Tax=Citrobacter sp. Cb019 TaxID=2985017 RepID=UPI00257B304B|nr:restriction endonuclease subunit S [Citrobacter sp. Cb019]MDM3401862.1 restriction endonuclease subunit S [Citrobacter sp. Cb019]
MVPKLRFGGFKEEWTMTLLSKLATKITDGTHDTPDTTSEGIPYLTAIHVKDGYIDYKNCYYLDKLTHSLIYKRCNPEKNDLLIVNIGAGTGTCALNTVDYEFSLKNVALVKPNKNKVYPFYLLQVQRKNAKKLFHELTSGGAQPFLSLKEIGKLKIPLCQYDEQTKIADFLSSVDDKITLLNQQYDLLCQYKKGMMQKIFSQEVRFKDENGEMFPAWQENSLSSLGNAYNGLTGKTAEDFGKGVFYITYKQIFDNRIINPKGFGLVKITKNEKQNKVEYGDLFFTTSSETPDEVAFCSVFLETELIDCYLNSFCFGYRVKNIDKSDPVFLSFLFRSGYFRAKVKTLAQGSTRYNISKTQFMMLSVNIPVTKEQTKIANFLSALDDKIAVKKAELDKLKIWKQGLLQQMFV